MNRLTNLKQSIRHAKNSDFYKNFFSDIHADDLRTMEDFEKLPFTDKGDLRNAYPLGLNAVYDKVFNFLEDFTHAKGTLKCRELLDGCDLSSEEGKKLFKEKNLKENCRGYMRLCCELLDKYLEK